MHAESERGGLPWEPTSLSESLTLFDPTRPGSSGAGSTIFISNCGISFVARNPPPELAIRQTVSAAPTRTKGLGGWGVEDAAEKSRRGGLGAKPHQSPLFLSQISLPRARATVSLSPFLPLAFATAGCRRLLSCLVIKGRASATCLAFTHSTVCVAVIATTSVCFYCAYPFSSAKILKTGLQ
jgi:hypothetical protein